MAAFHGKGGEAWFNSAEATEVMKWTIQATADVAETTSMQATNGYKTYVTGFFDWSATAEVEVDGLAWDYSTEFGVTYALSFHGGAAAASEAQKYTGLAMLVGMDFDLDKEGVGVVTYSFVGNGALTEGADAA
jgi:hypothetical protein